MTGLMTFSSLAAAFKAGFQIYDKEGENWIVRIQTLQGWQKAIVIEK